MLTINNEKIALDEKDFTKIKVLCDFLFFDQYKNSASFPRFQHAFAPLVKNTEIDLFEAFKKLCGEKKKYLTFGRILNSFLLNSKKEKNDESQMFLKTIMDDKIIKNEEEESGIQYENAIRYSTKQGNLRNFVSKICVITDENQENIKGLRIYYDDFFKNDLFFNKRGEKYLIPMELNLIGDLIEDKIAGRADMNTMDGITNVFGTYTDKITFIGFKCRSGKTAFYGKPEGQPFFYGNIGKHVKTFKCEVKNGVLTSILPGFVDVLRRNTYIDKNINEVQNEIDHINDFIYEEEYLSGLNDPDEINNNIRVPMIPDDYFFDKSLEDKIKGTDINEIIPENDINKDLGKYAENDKEIDIDVDKLLEEAELYSKYKELRETLQNQKDYYFETGKFDEIPPDPNGEYKHGDNIEDKDINLFIQNPQNYNNLVQEVGLSVEEALKSEDPINLNDKLIGENNYPEVDTLKKKHVNLRNRNDMQNYYDNVNSGIFDRVTNDFDDENINMKLYNKKETKEEIEKGEKKAKDNWRKLSFKLSSNEGIFILQTIGAVIRAKKLIKDEESGKSKMPTEEKLQLYKILKVNKPIIDMLSKAHMESLRNKNEEDNLRKELENLKNNVELSDEEKKNFKLTEKQKQCLALQAASNAFKEKPKELRASDLPLISSKLERLNEMKNKAKNKKEEGMIKEYIHELTRDKIAIINAIKEKKINNLKRNNTAKFNNIVEENKNEREKLIKEESKQIEKAKTEEDNKKEKELPKTKEISFKKINIPSDIKIYRNQKLTTPIFSDELFPPIKKNLCPIKENGSWYLPKGINKEDIRGWEKYKWTPVSNILDTPNYQVYYDDINSENIIQGDFKNCYFITALSALSKYPNLVKKLFLHKEKTIEHIYGVYLRINGIWKLILLDDFVPYYFDSEGQYHFVFSSSHEKELWVVLLEKAWVKLIGNYARSIDGSPNEAFDALTDAYTEILYVSPHISDDIYNNLNYGQINGYLLTAETSSEEKIEEYGLVPFRAYIIIEVKEIMNKNGKVKLIHLKNLWGNGDEWCGDWCNSSSLWTDDLRKICNVPDNNEINKLPTGTFWMSIDDFCKYFYITYITHIHPNYFNSQVKVSKENCFNGPYVHKFFVSENDTDCYIQLHQKNPKITLKDGTNIKPVYGYMILTDEEGNYIDNSGKGTFNNCLRIKLNRGNYYLVTDINYRFFNIKHGYSLSIYSSNPTEINEGDVDVKSLLDACLIGFSYRLKSKDINGAKLISTDVGNCPLKAAILDNRDGNEDLFLKANLKRYGNNSADFYCEDGHEKDTEIVKKVPKGEVSVIIAYPYTNSSLYDLNISAEKC